MKIAFIGGRDIHRLGGIETYMFNLSSELSKLGHEPIVYCESDHNGEEIVNGFKVIYHKSIGGRFLCKILLGLKSTLNAIIAQKDVQIFHYNAWPPSLWSWIPRLCGRKAILQGHGLEWKRTKYTPIQRYIMHFMEWFTAKLNKNIIMVSQEQTDYFAQHYNKKAVTIPCATTMPGETTESDILVRNNIDKERYFLFLGRLVQEKNPDYLIKAFIKSELLEYKLVIAGSNDAQPDYVAYLHELAAEASNVIFTGAVYGADKDALLANCYAFCIPSTLEGLPITLLEAMSHGRVCVASDIQANREALGNSGIWCKVEDVDSLSSKLKYVADNYHLVSSQGVQNKDRVLNYFTWPKVTEQYIDYITNEL